MLEHEFVETCRQIWPNLTKEEYCHKAYAAIFRYFETQTRTTAKFNGSDKALGFSNLWAIIDGLTLNRDVILTRSSYIASVKAQFPEPTSETIITNYGERALRMMLGLDIRIDSRGIGSRAGSSTIDWGDSTSLAEAIENHFVSDGHHTRGMITGRIDPSLSLAHLCTCRGFKVFWTSNISEHLTISWKSKIITVYEHKIFLWNHLRSSTSSIIPRPILEEAIDTLNLLFPLNDRPTTTFLAQNGKDFQGLGYCSRPRDLCLDLGRFNVWRDRIAELVEIMNEEPKGLKQLALEKDGRNFLPFVTFWVAIAVALLSLLSIPFTIVSMFYTIKQFDLALAQACADPDTRDALPQYCSSG
ncbi:hypothetical protein F4859DRAFT_466893 [Xylaria cf. heliscus]|nr:hypothetical protein F4859DRAFT_466893 [Xylaria cf. heliscus]